MTGDAPFAYEFATRPSTMTASELQRRRGASNFRPGDLGMKDALLGHPHRAVLVILESVNAGGKDGTIEELRGTLGSGGLRMERIKRPFPAVKDHDLLQVAAPLVPIPGELVVFNRSYYEEPVHVAAQARSDPRLLCDRIVLFENQLASEGVRLVKLFIHIDKDEQLRRLEARKRHRHLRHLHNPFDHHDQTNWADLMSAYDVVLSLTHTRASPWSMIPGNDRLFRNRAVEDVLYAALG